MGRPKKRRGAPPGNQNARKHGYYSNLLTPEEITAFYQAVNIQGANPAAVALRLKLAKALQNASGNPRVLADCARLLFASILASLNLTVQETRELKKFLRRLLPSLADGDVDLAEQIVAETLGVAENLQNKPYL